MIKKKNILYNKYISSLFFSKKQNKWEKSNKILDDIIFFLKNRLINLFFIYHTLGLIIRWYISFHAPWSNEYESLIFISWCILFAGILISKNRNLIIPGLSCLVASLILYIAYINLINPEITNLVPVLKSYWLVIHVTIITSSYGFLCVSSLIGLLVIIIFIINKFLLKKNIKLIIYDLNWSFSSNNRNFLRCYLGK
ncbi:MAG: cytochrome c biogenesis protein CcsA [Candidatus Karelsulcia muelleri]